MTSSLGTIAPAALEDWLRERYFTASHDISSSGVSSWDLGQLRLALDVGVEELDALRFDDSPSTGARELREAVATRYAPGRAADVMCTHGASEALFLAIAALVRPGDEVVVVRPAYQSLTSIAAALGARLVPWDLDPARDWVPDLGRLRSLLGPRTRLVVANFPHNPTGATLDRGGLEDLLTMCDEHDVTLLWDGSFAEITYDAPVLPDPAALCTRVVSVSTLSKTFGLPGLRVGWCIAPPELLADMVRVRDYTTLNTSPLSELLATRTVQRADLIIGPRRRRAARHRRMLLDWAEVHRDAVDLVPPAGGVSAFVRCRNVPAREVARRLDVEDGVLVVPGDAFGFPDRLRIGFGGGSEDLVAGLGALARSAGSRVDATVPTVEDDHE